AAEHAVELADAGGAVGRGLRVDVGDRLRARARSGRGGARPGRLGTACLGERPPGLALAAPPDPLGRAPPALGADEPGARGLGGGLGAHPANLPAAPDTARSCAVTALGTRPDAAARPRCRRRPPSAGRPP